jgi:hypothetical protein
MQIQSTKFAKNDNAKHFGRSSITNKPNKTNVGRHGAS